MEIKENNFIKEIRPLIRTIFVHRYNECPSCYLYYSEIRIVWERVDLGMILWERVDLGMMVKGWFHTFQSSKNGALWLDAV